MAAAGHFVRERIPVPCSVPEAGRLILELVSTARDCDAEPAGPMTFRIVRRYRPTWAVVASPLVVPLFIRRTEVCRIAVIEARMGAELLLEGTLETDLHQALLTLGRVPEAARVSTFGPRPVPQALAPMPMPGGDSPDIIDLRSHSGDGDLRRPVPPPDEFSDLIPPPLLPPVGPPSDPGVRDNRPPAGPTPHFQPMHAHAGGENGNGSSRLPSAFRSPRDAVQPQGVPSHSPEVGRVPAGAEPERARRPGLDRDPAEAPATVAGRKVDGRPRYTISVDTGEQAVAERLLIIGRAPSRREQEQHAALLAVNDPTLSVSKTHLAIEVDDQGLWITDRRSTNGTWIDEGRGALRPVPAGERTPIPVGARVLIGERVLTFTRLG